MVGGIRRSAALTAKIMATIAAVFVLAAAFVGIYNLNGGSLDFSDREVLFVPTASMDGEPQDYPIPTIARNSLVMVERIGPDDAGSIAVGDVICYRYDGFTIVHRVVEIGSGYFVTHGDNNPPRSTETVSFDDVTGKVVGTSKAMGDVVSFLESPWVFIIIAAALIIVSILSVASIMHIIRNDGDDSDGAAEMRSADTPVKGPANHGRWFTASQGFVSAAIMAVFGAAAMSVSGMSYGSATMEAILNSDSLSRIYLQLAFGFGGFMLGSFGTSMVLTHRDPLRRLSGSIYIISAVLVMLAAFATTDRISIEDIWTAVFLTGIAASAVYGCFAGMRRYALGAGLMTVVVFGIAGGALLSGSTAAFGLGIALPLSVAVSAMCEAVCTD